MKVFVTSNAEGALLFDAVLSLNDYELPDDARIFLDAYRQTTFMRFAYGTVKAPGFAVGESRMLSEFTSKDGLLFRAKVISSGDQNGLILAEGDQIPIAIEEEQEEARIPLLPTEPKDLGQEIWCVDIGPSGPILEVSKDLPD